MSDKKNIFLTSKKQTWETPQALFDHLARWFSFNLDPCAEPETTKCDRFFTEEDNGLKQDWGDNSVVFVNPPYRDSKLWLKKSRAVSGTSNTDIVLLLKASVGTNYFHDNVYCNPNAIAKPIRGRLVFGLPDNTDPAPFDSILVLMSQNPESVVKFITAVDLWNSRVSFEYNRYLQDIKNAKNKKSS